MAMIPPKNKSFDPVPAGNHVARLYDIIHVGTVPTTYQGQERMSDQVRLTFELCNETKVFKEGEEPRPYSISTSFMTFSMGQKANLRRLIEGMLGVALHDNEADSFDLEQLLERPCLLNVVHTESNGNTYANIKGASPLPKGMTAPPQFNAPRKFEIMEATKEQIEALPQFIREKVYASNEYKLRFEKPDVDTNADVPF